MKQARDMLVVTNLIKGDKDILMIIKDIYFSRYLMPII